MPAAAVAASPINDEAAVGTTRVCYDTDTLSAVSRVARVVGNMRRVASAPALKDAQAYQAPSAAAAVAAAEAAANAEVAAAVQDSTADGSCGSTLASSTSSPWFRSSRATKKTPSNRPSGCSACPAGRCSCLEVYVVSRAFTEFGGPVLKRMPPNAREHMVDMGICHYMTVFKTPDGQLVQFDFGPTGGDVQKAHGPLATLLRRAHAAAALQAHANDGNLSTASAALGAGAGPADSRTLGSLPSSSNNGSSGSSSNSVRGMVYSPSAPVLPLASLHLDVCASASTPAQQGSDKQQKKGVAGEIRERHLAELPCASMYVGRTQLSLADIRHYNSAQGRMQYMLHDHDCRHYVNRLVKYTTGVEHSTQHMKRHYFYSRHAERWLWYGWFISVTQLATDVGNWSHIQAGAAATLLAVTGRNTVGHLKALALPMLPALKSLPLMLPATGFVAAAAGAGGSSAAAAGAAGGLATSLKLPAALLLKRPAAVAAAGGAGAAAAAIRTVPGGVDASTAAGGGSSSGANAPRLGGFGAISRPLGQWKDSLGQGLRGAVLALRKVAAGSREAWQQQQRRQQQAVRQGFAVDFAARSQQQQQQRWGWFGRRLQTQRQLSYTDSRVVACAGGGIGSSIAGSDFTVGSSSGRQSGAAGSRQGAGLVAGVGRHVLWLGSAAAKVTNHAVMAAGRQVGYFVGGRPIPGVAAATAAMGGANPTAGAVLLHSASSGNIPRHQQQQQQQQQQSMPWGGLGSQRSKSAPALALMAPAAGVGAHQPRRARGAASGAGAAVDEPGLYPSHQTLLNGSSNRMSRSYDEVWGCGGSSSSVICSSVGGGSTGVGRQVLTLPSPRLSWGRRAGHAVVQQ